MQSRFAAVEEEIKGFLADFHVQATRVNCHGIDLEVSHWHAHGQNGEVWRCPNLLERRPR
jgi:hypothetical protein